MNRQVYIVWVILKKIKHLKFTEIESTMVVTMGRKLRVSVLQDEKVLETNCITLWIYAKLSSCMLKNG